MSIGKNIKFHRNKKRLSQRKLAFLIGISPSYVSKIEKNIKIPSIPLLQKIAYALEVCPKTIMGCYNIECNTCSMKNRIERRESMTNVNEHLKDNIEKLIDSGIIKIRELLKPNIGLIEKISETLELDPVIVFVYFYNQTK